MPVREQVKFALIKSKTSLTEVVRQMNETKPVSLQSLTRKINASTLRYDDAEEIAKLLGYKIRWIKNCNSLEGSTKGNK